MSSPWYCCETLAIKLDIVSKVVVTVLELNIFVILSIKGLI
ncbi:hypothetical protein [Spiroplasma endosymbiont of Nebria brevicollis]